MICRRLLRRMPWVRRTAHQRGLADAQERAADANRRRLVDAHAAWVPLARDLSRIEHESLVNDWTATAKRIFSGRD